MLRPWLLMASVVCGFLSVGCGKKRPLLLTVPLLQVRGKCRLAVQVTLPPSTSVLQEARFLQEGKCRLKMDHLLEQ